VLSFHDGIYFAENIPNDTISILYEWFRDDVGSSVDSWREWLSDNSEEMQDMESNATWLEKEGDKVTLGLITDIILYCRNGLEIPENYKIMISIKNAIELIDSWEKLIQTCPPKLIIYEENGIYRLEEVQ
jgi:hypothetical protein